MNIKIVFKSGVEKTLTVHGYSNFRSLADFFYDYENLILDDIAFSVSNVDYIEEVKD